MTDDVLPQDGSPPVSSALPLPGSTRAAAQVPAEDPVIKLAYEEARTALKEQDTTLGNVRNRATSIFGAATIAFAFAASVGLVNTDPARGPVLDSWARWPLFGLMLGIGVVVHIVLWPCKTWNFGPHGAAIADLTDHSVDAVRRGAIKSMSRGAELNNSILAVRMRAYRVSVALLAASVLVLLVAIAM